MSHDDEILRELSRLRWGVAFLIGAVLRILQQEVKVAGELAGLTDQVHNTVGVMESAEAALVGIKAKLDDAIAAGDPAALASLSVALGDETTRLAAAIVANSTP